MPVYSMYSVNVSNDDDIDGGVSRATGPGTPISKSANEIIHHLSEL